MMPQQVASPFLPIKTLPTSLHHDFSLSQEAEHINMFSYHCCICTWTWLFAGRIK